MVLICLLEVDMLIKISVKLQTFSLVDGVSNLVVVQTAIFSDPFQRLGNQWLLMIGNFVAVTKLGDT